MTSQLIKDVRITDLEEPVPSPGMQAMLEQLKDADIKLDGDTFLALARQQMDVEVEVDIDDGLAQRFENTFREITEQAPTHAVGRFALQQMAVNGIIQTSYMNYILRHFPESAATPVEKPLIVAGLPRSGTTHLLQLLTTEPELIWMKNWEARMPFPSPSVLSGDVPDNREEQSIEAHHQRDSLMPLQRSIYDAGVQDSTEEIECMVHGCYGLVPAMLGDSPEYDRTYYGQDRVEDYEYLYRQLQALQWVKECTSGQRWLLKSPAHLGVLASVNKVFPDASLVFTHRDPASVFTSLINLLGYGTRVYYSSITKEQLIGKARRMLHGFLRGLIENEELFEGRCEHLYFHDLKKDVIAYVEKIYALTGMNFDAAAQARIAEQAKKFSRGHTGVRVVYDIEADFGLTRDELREEFSYYLDRYPVDIEESHQ